MIKILFFLSLIFYSLTSVFAQQITIITPNGGEVWQNSNSYGITWTDDIIGSVKIELFKSGTLNSVIIASTESDGYYQWIPNVTESGNDYKIKISSVANSSVFDFSDENFSLNKSQLNIISPNGGEQIQTSALYGIVWEDDFLGPVKLELYKGGAFYSTIVDTTQSDGYYLWSVNAAESGIDYKVKITSLASNNDFDFSDNDFSITQSVLTLTSPNGGENWTTSNAYGIVWNDNISGPVKLELYKGGVFYSSIADTTPSDGYYAWTVNAADSGNNYRIKITSLASENDFDFSDSDFTITKSIITISSPNGGENWQTSSSYGIVWTDNIFSPVKIELYKGGTYYLTIADTTQSDGYFAWSVNAADSGSDYRVKITSLGSSNDFDYSDNDFTITKSQVTVTAPNGGESWETSTSYGIIWTDDIFVPVKIELYKGGAFYSTIVDTTQSDGYYLWSVNAAESGNDYKVKITSLGSSNDFDYSDADFSIAKNIITISRPNGGETLHLGTDNSIVWEDSIFAPVKIELYKGGVFYSTIIDTTPSSGFYLWNIHDVQNGNDYKIKVTSLASNNDFDFSDGNFTITNPNGIEENLDQIPKTYTLMQNYPNPFNPSTSIVYGLPQSCQVRIELFNALGQHVKVIFDSYKDAGYHKLQFNASVLSSGVYFYRIQAESPTGKLFVETKKMLFLK